MREWDKSNEETKNERKQNNKQKDIKGLIN